MEVFVVFDTMGGGRVVGVYDSRALAEAIKQRDPHYLRIEARELNAVDEERLAWGRPKSPDLKDSWPKNLHHACFSGDAAMIEELLSGDADPNAVQDGLTPLHLAVAGGRPAVVMRLLLAGANPDPESWIEDPDPALWTLIDRRARKKFFGSLGMTPLHLACERGSAELVNILLARGADARLFVLLDSGAEGAFAWTPKELACPPREAASETRQQIAALIDRHLAQQPETAASRARQQKRVDAAW